MREAAAVYRKLVLEGGHFFVCGDCTMAEHVYQTLKVIIQERGVMTDSQVERYMLKLRVSTGTGTRRYSPPERPRPAPAPSLLPPASVAG